MKILVIIGLLFSTQVFGQLIPIRTFTLPSGLNESSGLAIYKGLLYTHNDGGNPNEVYALDTNALLKQTYTIQNASNLDWEAMQITSAGDLLIGDIGNNGNNRQNLRFYWIKDFLNAGSNTLTADTITFSYVGQTYFPPSGSKLHFDAEAFIAFNDSLYIFTKNRSNPYNGYSYMHGLPLQKGNHKTVLMDSIYTGGGPKELDWITDACLDSNTLWLLSHGFVMRFDSFQQNRLSQSKRIVIGQFGQKEAVAYAKPHLWITDEKNVVFGGGKLYQYAVDSLRSSSIQTASISLRSYLHLDEDGFTLRLPHSSKVQFYTLDGKLIKEQQLTSGNHAFTFDQIKAQSFVIKIQINHQPHHYRFLKP